MCAYILHEVSRSKLLKVDAFLDIVEAANEFYPVSSFSHNAIYRLHVGLYCGKWL